MVLNQLSFVPTKTQFPYQAEKGRAQCSPSHLRFSSSWAPETSHYLAQFWLEKICPAIQSDGPENIEQVRNQLGAVCPYL